MNRICPGIYPVSEAGARQSATLILASTILQP